MTESPEAFTCRVEGFPSRADRRLAKGPIATKAKTELIGMHGLVVVSEMRITGGFMPIGGLSGQNRLRIHNVFGLTSLP